MFDSARIHSFHQGSPPRKLKCIEKQIDLAENIELITVFGGLMSDPQTQNQSGEARNCPTFFNHIMNSGTTPMTTTTTHKNSNEIKQFYIFLNSVVLQV